MRQLPSGWRWARLGDVAKYINGCPFRPEDWVRSGLPIIRIENLTSDGAPFNYYDQQVEERYIVRNGDLLISWSATLDAFMWSRGTGVVNQHIFKVQEDKSLIHRKYLYYVVRSVMDEIRAEVHGATMQHITKGRFEAIKIPLPPLEGQKRIAAILDEKMSAIERARAAAEAQLEAAQALPGAYLRAVFSGPEAEGWPRVRVGEISSLVRDGPHVTPAYVPEGVPFLTVRNIVNRTIDLTDVSYISPEDHAVFSKAAKAERGDILYTKDGTLGVPCVVDRDLEFSFFVSVALIKPLRDRVDPNYLALALDSADVLRQVDHLAAGAGLKHMVLRSIRALEIPLPPLDIQRRVAAELQGKLKIAEQAQEGIQERVDTVGRLPTAYLRQAFNGEL